MDKVITSDEKECDKLNDRINDINDHNHRTLLSHRAYEEGEDSQTRFGGVVAQIDSEDDEVVAIKACGEDGIVIISPALRDHRGMEDEVGIDFDYLSDEYKSIFPMMMIVPYKSEKNGWCLYSIIINEEVLREPGEVKKYDVQITNPLNVTIDENDLRKVRSEIESSIENQKDFADLGKEFKINFYFDLGDSSSDKVNDIGKCAKAVGDLVPNANTLITEFRKKITDLAKPIALPNAAEVKVGSVKRGLGIDRPVYQTALERQREEESKKKQGSGDQKRHRGDGGDGRG